MLTWARIEDRQSGKRLLVANVQIHGLRGADEVCTLLEQMARVHEGEPLILLGDFNFPPGSPGYREVARRMPALREAAAETGNAGQGTLIGPGGSTIDGTATGPQVRTVTNAARIDHIFVCGFRSFTDYRVMPLPIGEGSLFASDHHPVGTTVRDALSCQGRAC